MAEAVVSTILGQLVSVLHQQVEEEVRLVVGVDEEVKTLTSNLQAIASVLEDAECKQVKEKAVGDWLDKLKEVSYDIEDVLDEWNTAIQKLREFEAENVSKLVTKVCSLMSSCYRFCSRRVVIRHDIAKKIKDLNRALDVIATEKNRFNLSSMKSTGKVERQITTSVVDITKIHGRDHYKKEITNYLLSESSSGPPSLPIISIVGMGGIGKTTLARLVFNDNEVKAYFDTKIWVCVSEPFEEIRIAKAILESLTNKKLGVKEYETVLKNIKELIKEKKFLLVLDDVWTGESTKWEQLVDSLKHGSSKSRILVTTRKENVAKSMESTHIIPLEILSNEGSWSLFRQVAFSGRTDEECQKFEDIGKKIVKKCKGLPLAVKTLGSLLRIKNTIQVWQMVLDSEIWELEEVEKELFPPLLLSYYDLPFILKKCFLYCAIFPKDYVIEKDKLIKLWMAQNYLGTNQSIDLELVGENCFENLVTRSFFQDLEKNKHDGSIIRCKMHDTVHDFAQFLTKNECFTIEFDGLKKSRLECPYKARHAMIWNGVNFPDSVYRELKLRSLVSEGRRFHWSESILVKIFDQLTCLRSLVLNSFLLEELPRGINKLIHLKYLNLSGTSIRTLPETLCELCNLQTLDLSYCGRLRKLPKGMRKLLKLRHLINHNTNYLVYMPKGIKSLTCLVTLSKVVVRGDNRSCTFDCLNYLNHLGGSLHIKCRDLADVGEINNAEFKNKENLLGLMVDFKDVLNEEAIEDFQPPPNLEKLQVVYYDGNPKSLNWMLLLTKLKELRLENWKNCERLPPLGKLLSLETLVIRSWWRVDRVGNELLGIQSDNTLSSSSSLVTVFPKLQCLEFLMISNCKEWDYVTTTRDEEAITIMPCLRSLKIELCSDLKTLPHYLLQLTTLEACSFYESTALQERYQVEKVEHSANPKFKIIDKSVMIRRDSLHCDVHTTDVAID